jgi:hypothetical protein
MTCSSSSPTVAGGTGAGNPAVIAMIADTADTAGLPKVSAQTVRSQDGPKLLIIKDQAGLVFAISEAYVMAQRISFPAPDTDCEPSETEAPLTCDGSDIVLDVPLVFDLMTGNTSPPVGSFILPTGSYGSATIEMCSTCVSLGTQTGDEKVGQYGVVLRGEFEYRGQTRSVEMLLAAKGKKTFLSIPAVELNGGDTALLAIVLDPHKWLEEYDIARCMDNSDLLLDADGNLTISESTVAGECLDLPSDIARSILNSGVFKRRNDSSKNP